MVGLKVALIISQNMSITDASFQHWGYSCTQIIFWLVNILIS